MMLYSAARPKHEAISLGFQDIVTTMGTFGQEIVSGMGTLQLPITSAAQLLVASASES